MIKSLTSLLSISLVVLSSHAAAEALMTKSQYADYSVLYQCADIKFHGDLAKKEEELIRIEDSFGLNDDNFDAFDELITEYENDDSLLKTVRVRTKTECSLSTVASNAL